MSSSANATSKRGYLQFFNQSFNLSSHELPPSLQFLNNLSERKGRRKDCVWKKWLKKMFGEGRRLWAMRENLNYRGELQQRADICGIIF